MEEVDTSLEDSVEVELWLVVVLAVRGLRISEASLVSAICSFLRFLDAVAELKPDMRYAGTGAGEGFVRAGAGCCGLSETHPICDCWPG
jgi:hypothetical protein